LLHTIEVKRKGVLKVEINSLIIPTLTGYTDVFRPTVKDKKTSQAFLFNPQDNRYRLNGKTLLFNNFTINKEEVIEFAEDPAVNMAIKENVLVYGIFSYLCSRKGLEYNTIFEIGITDISIFFGVTMGEKGFKLFEKLKSLESVYGVITETGEVFPLLTVKKSGLKLKITTEYMHRVFNRMIAISKDKENNKPYFFTNLANVSIVSSRNKTAALIIIELIRLIVSAGKFQSHITIYRLEKYIPQLRAIRVSSRGHSQKNRDLKRIFTSVYQLISSRTEITSTFDQFTVERIIPTVNQFNLVIKVYRKGYKKIENEGFDYNV
jgi:hypothetical protein